VMVEGGADVINELLKPQYADLVDAVIITIAPTWLGRGGVVVSPERRVDGSGNAVNAARLERTVWTQMGEDVVLCGKLAG
jgi:2,5-diamino-6-(ribosylamino)-4(3H)-pyrimidinone 5'-phosphate reductase